MTRGAHVELRGGDRRLDFALAPGGVVEGVVRGAATGETVAGAVVRYTRESLVRMPGGGGMTVSGRGGATLADGAGRFRITGLPAGALHLTARSPRGASAEPTVIPNAVAEQVSGVELYVAEAFAISGTVVTAEDGAPAAGLLVSADAPRAGAHIPATAPNRRRWPSS